VEPARRSLNLVGQHLLVRKHTNTLAESTHTYTHVPGFAVLHVLMPKQSMVRGVLASDPAGIHGAAPAGRVPPLDVVAGHPPLPLPGEICWRKQQLLQLLLNASGA